MTTFSSRAYVRQRMRTLSARSETAITRAILQYLAMLPEVIAWRNNVGAFAGEYKGKKRFVRFSRKGLPDIIGWKREIIGGWKREIIGLSFVARFLAIEVKRPGKDATPEQCAFLQQVRDAGGIAMVAHSVEEVRAGLLGIEEPLRTKE